MVALLGLPADIRGYEDVKMRNLRAYLDRRGEAAVKLGVAGPTPTLVDLVGKWKMSS